MQINIVLARNDLSLSSLSKIIMKANDFEPPMVQFQEHLNQRRVKDTGSAVFSTKPRRFTIAVQH